MKIPSNKLSRRELIAAIPLAAVPVAAMGEAGERAETESGADQPKGAADKRIGMALGAGGANGLAHIAMLEVLDEMNLRPHHISGSSIGAVIGALYASGMSAADIRQLVMESFPEDNANLLRKLVSDQTMHWLELVELEIGNGGLLDSGKILSHFYDSISADSFADLDVRLDVVAGDLWAKEQVVLNEGALLPAVQASMAIPGVFEAVELEGRVLIDGGTVNPVPWDLLFEDCDLVIGIDVSGVRSRPEAGENSYFDTLFNAIKVMQGAIVAEKMQRRAPDIFIAPEVQNIRALEFYEANTVFEQSAPAKEQLRRALSTKTGV